MNGKKLGGLIAFTIAELVGLVVWFQIVTADVVTLGQQIQGIGVLVVLLIVEHFIAFATNVGGPFPSLRLVGISASETVLWVVWLLVFGLFGGLTGVLVASVFLAATMFLQHSVEKNVFAGRPLFSDLLKGEVTVFTLIEVVAAGAWLYLAMNGQAVLGVVILTVGIAIEHYIQSSQKEPPGM